MRYFSLIVLIWLFPIKNHAQYLPIEDARSFALSGASSAIPCLYSAFTNPGAINIPDKLIVALNYQNQYMLPELGVQSVAGAVPASEGVITAGISYSGFQAWNEFTGMLSYGRTLGRGFSAGILVGYRQQKVEAIEQITRLPVGGLGIFYTHNSGLSAGLSSQYSGVDNMLITNLGIAYQQEKYTLCLDLETDGIANHEIAAGAELWLAESIALLAGVRIADYGTYSFGILSKFKTFAITLGCEQHPVLGISTAIGLTLNFPS